MFSNIQFQDPKPNPELVAHTMKNKRTLNTQHTFHIPVDRRRFFKSMAAASAGFTLSGYLAEALTATPSTTQGPYYPLADDIPLDKDNDLVQLNDNLTAAAGVITYVTGRVLDANGNPIKNALVELWHADREGDYLYSTGVGLLLYGQKQIEAGAAQQKGQPVPQAGFMDRMKTWIKGNF